MNTDTIHLRHRHFVVLPVAIALAMASATPIWSRVPLIASLVAAEQPSTQSFAGQGLALVEAGSDAVSTAEGLALRSGSVLAAGTAAFHMQVGRAALTGFDGAAYVSYRAPALTVAAISSPVLVHMGEGTMIVPVGRQWRTTLSALPMRKTGWEAWTAARETQAIPATFLQEQGDRAQSITVDTQPQGHASLALPLFSWGKLPAALERQRGAEQMAVVAAIAETASQGDPQSLSASLSDSAVRQDIRSLTLDQRLSLLASAADERSIAALLPPLVTDDARLILLFHPQYRRWVAPLDLAPLADESLPLWTLLFPVSDTLPVAYPSLLREAYVREAVDYLRSQVRAEALVRALAANVQDALQVLPADTYPERVEAYGQFARTLSVRFSIDMPERPPQVSSVQASSAMSGCEAQPMNPQIAERHVRDLLIQWNVLSTVRTSIQAEKDGVVRVEDIVFPSSDGDRLLSFDVDARCNRVRNIVMNDQPQPLSLSVEAFGEWVR